jgi:hypothetical protein
MKKLTFDTILRFGKHKGRFVSDLVDEDPDYLFWINQNVRPVSRSVLNACRYARIDLPVVHPSTLLDVLRRAHQRVEPQFGDQGNALSRAEHFKLKMDLMDLIKLLEAGDPPNSDTNALPKADRREAL